MLVELPPKVMLPETLKSCEIVTEPVIVPPFCTNVLPIFAAVNAELACMNAASVRNDTVFDCV